MYQELYLKPYVKWINLITAVILFIFVGLILFGLFLLNQPDVRGVLKALPSDTMLLNPDIWNILLMLPCAYSAWIVVKIIDGIISKKPYAVIFPDRIEFNELSHLFHLKHGTLYWTNIEEILPRLPNAPFDNAVIIKLKDPTKFRNKQTIVEKIVGASLWVISIGKRKEPYYNGKITLLDTQEMSASELRNLISEASGIEPYMDPTEIRTRKKYQRLAIGICATYLVGFGIFLNYDTIAYYIPDSKITSQTLDIKMLAEHGDPDAQTKLGWRYSNGYQASKDSKIAVYWWRKAAKQGWMKAEYNMGWAYYRGRGVKRNYKKAFEWYSKAAAKGFPLAESAVGGLYSRGRGVERDYEKAFEWRMKAALKDNINAQGGVGWHYAKGNGVAQDYDHALKWFTKAAEKEDGYSLGWIGRMYEKGYGVEQSREKAVEYYERAAAKNSKFAKKALKRLRG